MIRTFDINLNAAHPELPLMEATSIVGSPSTANIHGVPSTVGTWSVTKVYIQVSYPDGSTTTEEAAKTAQGIWTATVPQCEISGRVRSGFAVLADGVDEFGVAINGYILGVGDFAVYTRGLIVRAGETTYTLRYFDTVPELPNKGDVAPVDGVLKLYDGYTWMPFADEVDLSDYYTKEETDAAINALAAYYITADAAGNAFATRAALINATTVYSGGVVRIPTRNDYAVVLADETHSGAEYRYIYAVADGQTTGQWEAQYPIETNDYTALGNKPQINGVTLSGNKTSADLRLAAIGDVQKLDNRTADDLGRLYINWSDSSGTPNNRAASSAIYFKPSVFGMPTGGILRSITVRTSDTIRNTQPVYLKLIDPTSGTAPKAEAGPVMMSELNTDYRFTFAEDYPLTASTEYRLAFSTLPGDSQQSNVQLRLNVLSYATDLYFGSNKTWRPIMTAKWTSQTVKAALDEKVNLALLSVYVAQILANLAPTFSTEEAYSVGELVIYNNILYRCIATHTAGGFGPEHFSAVKMSELLTYYLELVTDSNGNRTAVTLATGRNPLNPVGPYSVVQGTGCSASGTHAVARGYYTDASAERAIAIGDHTSARGPESFTGGVQTEATNAGEVAFGLYNKSNVATSGTRKGKTVFSVGGGNPSSRKNAIEVYTLESFSQPLVFVQGVGGYDGTNPTNTNAKDLATLLANMAEPYDLATLIDSYQLRNRAINFVWPEADEYDLDFTFPDATPRKARDFLIAIYQNPGFTGSISFSLPTGATVYGDGFSLQLADGETGLYSVTEIFNNRFLIKGQKIAEVV